MDPMTNRTSQSFLLAARDSFRAADDAINMMNKRAREASSEWRRVPLTMGKGMSFESRIVREILL